MAGLAGLAAGLLCVASGANSDLAGPGWKEECPFASESALIFVSEAAADEVSRPRITRLPDQDRLQAVEGIELSEKPSPLRSG